MTKEKAIGIITKMTKKQLDAIAEIESHSCSPFLGFYDCMVQENRSCRRTNGKRYGIDCEICIAWRSKQK
jgi:gamma-glutamyl phosphate reductase